MTNTKVITQASSPCFPPAHADEAHAFLKALWRSDDHTKFIGTLDRSTGKFQNRPAPGIAEVIAYAEACSVMGLDSYIAPAEYTTPNNRTSQNAAGAWALWCDIDCGPGKPYANTEEAVAAVTEFCIKAQLPMPTHIVISGSGLHVYWVLDAFLDRNRWQAYALKLKALMKAHGLHADPSRTADIASVLRVPGTMNYKYQPPQPVTLMSSTDAFITLATMLDALDAAVLACGAEAEIEVPTLTPGTAAPLPNAERPMVEPPNLMKLESALRFLDPDCDEKTWKFYRLAPLAYLARDLPELAETYRELAIRWSSGELRGVLSEKWRRKGSNGLTGEQSFPRVWNRFLTDNYTGKRTAVGTIFFQAIKAGWVYEEPR